MKLFLGADHRGYDLKENVKYQMQNIKWEGGLEVVDLGAEEFDPDDDYTRYASAVAKEVVKNPDVDRGIVICGSGVGVDIVANRFPKIRCALACSPEQVKAARHDDDVNVLALGVDFLSTKEALNIIRVFLQTEFSGRDRHQRRIAQIEEIKTG